MYLGIDLGTSGVKVVVTDSVDAVIAQASAPLTVSRPQPMWSEQDPADWWRAVDAAVLQIDPALRRQVRGIGLSGQMHGAVLLDTADAVLRPAILWNDGRAQPQCAELERIEPRVAAITGNPVLAGFTAPKLLWVREQEPAVFAATRRVLLPKDYLRLLMTGSCWSDMSDASGTLWLDVGARRWSGAMLAACGLDEAMMPGLGEGSAASAALRAEVATAWGMARVPVAGGGGDNAAGAVGLGVTDPGDAFLSLGTSGVIFVVTDGFRPAPDRAVHAFAHAVPERWHRMSVMLSAASALDWATRLLGLADVGSLLDLAATADRRGVPVFLPYLSGERTPHADPGATAALAGMTGDTGPAEIAQAAMEGVAMGLRDGLDALTSAGVEIGPLAMAGGGARSTSWGRIIAAALDRPLIWRAGGTVGPALGAARLGRVAAGDSDVAGLSVAPAVTASVEPDASLAAAMAERQHRFRRLYPLAQRGG
ncbi:MULTISPECIES: xylulokinase [unclassified Sphingomonas]|uniref:xylulokinase n=1 Tax=unclassified Sphingomonas TaxID=196159 RepID=UPI00226AB733|nr:MULTISPECIES: xylulokinase [unclassified Sphingomonas]